MSGAEAGREEPLRPEADDDDDRGEHERLGDGVVAEIGEGAGELSEQARADDRAEQALDAADHDDDASNAVDNADDNHGDDASDADDNHDDDASDDDEDSGKGGRGNGGGKRKGGSKRLTNEEIAKRYPAGSVITVQVSKGPIGTKGARVTTNLSIPGRNLVLLPNCSHVGVSRRVDDHEERSRDGGEQAQLEDAPE